jgi:ankyrin repeat protein
LLLAVQFKNIPLVKLLLEFNANKTIKDNKGKTAFEYAVFSENEPIINLLK